MLQFRKNSLITLCLTGLLAASAEAVIVVDDCGFERGLAVLECDVRGEATGFDVFRLLLVFSRPDKKYLSEVEASALHGELCEFAVV